jgi:hypothetical protein
MTDADRAALLRRAMRLPATTPDDDIIATYTLAIETYTLTGSLSDHVRAVFRATLP